MKLSTALLIVGTYGGVLAWEETTLCLEEDVSSDKIAAQALNDIGELGTLQWILDDDHDTSPREIQLIYNIIEPENDKEFKPVTEEQLQLQHKAVSEVFKRYGFNIMYDPTLDKRVKDTEWSEGWIDREGQGLYKAQRHIRRGNYLTLNINIVPKLRNPRGGYALVRCTPPRHTYDSPGDYIDDGCFLNSDTLPYGNNQEYHDGKSLVHGIGHWLGLLHPWHLGDCQARNTVGTPIAKEPITSCDKKIDTCPERKGDDPIHNYMTFAPCSCQAEFTNEQVMTMRNWWEFRNRTDESVWDPIDQDAEKRKLGRLDWGRRPPGN